MTEFSLLSNFLTLLIELAGVLFFFRRLEKREERRLRALGLIWLAALLTVVYIPVIPSLNFSRDFSAGNLQNQVVRTLLNWAAVFGYLCLAGEKKKSVSAYLAALYVLIYMVAFNMREALRPFLGALGPRELEAVMLVLLAILQWGCVLVARRAMNPDEVREAGALRWPVVVLPMLVELYFKWSLISPGEGTYARPVDTVFYSLCATLGMLALVILFERNIAAQERRSRMQMEQMQLRYEMQNAKRAMQTNTDIRRLYHDMKNHLLALQTMVGKSEEAAGYLAELCSQFSEYETSLNTGSSVIDALLAEKMERARLDGIRFNVCADLSPFQFMSSVDLVTVFGNAVDNAVEALQMLPEGQERIVYVKTARYANMNVLRFSNQFAGELQLEEGRLRTAKENPELHGIGLSSIRKVVRRYGGNAETQFDNENGWFRLILMIPDPEEAERAGSGPAKPF